MVCRFEHKIVILPDTGISRHLARGDLDNVIAVMAPQLKNGNLAQAFRAGFDTLATLMEQKSDRPGVRGNELAAGTIVEHGA